MDPIVHHPGMTSMRVNLPSLVSVSVMDHYPADHLVVHDDLDDDPQLEFPHITTLESANKKDHQLDDVELEQGDDELPENELDFDHLETFESFSETDFEGAPYPELKNAVGKHDLGVQSLGEANFELKILRKRIEYLERGSHNLKLKSAILTQRHGSLRNYQSYLRHNHNLLRKHVDDYVKQNGDALNFSLDSHRSGASTVEGISAALVKELKRRVNCLTMVKFYPSNDDIEHFVNAIFHDPIFSHDARVLRENPHIRGKLVKVLRVHTRGFRSSLKASLFKDKSISETTKRFPSMYQCTMIELKTLQTRMNYARQFINERGKTLETFLWEELYQEFPDLDQKCSPDLGKELQQLQHWDPADLPHPTPLILPPHLHAPLHDLGVAPPQVDLGPVTYLHPHNSTS